MPSLLFNDIENKQYYVLTNYKKMHPSAELLEISGAFPKFNKEEISYVLEHNTSITQTEYQSERQNG